MYDEFLANTSDNEDNDESSTEMENDFNLPEPKRPKILDPRGSRRPGQAPIYRPGQYFFSQSFYETDSFSFAITFAWEN